MAGSISSTSIEVDSTSAPRGQRADDHRELQRADQDRRAPPGQQRLAPVPAVRRWMIAISSGSHTT